jgi:hypothetical protein
MTRYFVIFPVDSPEELLTISEKFDRSFVKLLKDERLYCLDIKISERQLRELFEAYPEKKVRSLVFSRIAEMPEQKNSPPRG